VKAIVAWVAVLGIQGALAEEEREWQTPQQVLAAIDAGKVPGKPQVWHSPLGSVVLHGDLFGDGRHLALVGTAGTSWAVAKDGAWEVAGRLDVEPVWVPPGKKTTDEEYVRYYNCDPPEVPFVLKDLDGDRVSEVLVAFNNDGYGAGYAIARKDGNGINLLDLRSGRGEPDWIGEFLIVNTIDSGRKAWWSGDTYYKWREGKPEPVVTWAEDCYDPEKVRWIAVRHEAGGKDRAFEIAQIGDEWMVRSCRWKQGVETAEEKDFATIGITMGSLKQDEVGTFDLKETIVFEMVTGIPGSVLWRRAFAEKSEGFDYAKAVSTCQVKVEGGDEAKALLKRVSE
jgi:hypothetical protein